VLTKPLAFLGAGRWTATIFADGPVSGAAFETPVVIRNQIVDAGMTLSLDLAPGGGQAILFEPL
jgi:alpha-glucosidase